MDVHRCFEFFGKLIADVDDCGVGVFLFAIDAFDKTFDDVPTGSLKNDCFIIDFLKRSFDFSNFRIKTIQLSVNAGDETSN